MGLLGRHAIVLAKLEEEGEWKAARTMLVFEIDALLFASFLPDAKISGDRVLIEKLSELQGSRAIDAATFRQVRGHIEHSKAPNALWKFLTWPMDLLLRYTDEQAVCANCPIPEVWVSIWDSLSVISDQMRSE